MFSNDQCEDLDDAVKSKMFIFPHQNFIRVTMIKSRTAYIFVVVFNAVASDSHLVTKQL